MANTTNYNWETPDDTDLVKDGAAAIRTLGNSIDTTTKNLNPETTTGDIAYRSATANTNTRLAIGSAGQVLTVAAGVPSWATPTVGDITEVQAGVGISVASGTGPIPVITNSSTDLITTAGDLLYGTAADTVARLGIGTVGQLLAVNSGATAPEWVAAPTPADKSVRAFASTSTITTITTYASVTFDGEDFDTDTMHSNVTNNSRLTFTTAGKYIVGSTITTSANQSVFIRLLLNGTTVIAEANAGNGGSDSRTISTLYNFAATDYVEVQVKSGNLTITTTTGNQCNFWAKKI